MSKVLFVVCASLLMSVAVLTFGGVSAQDRAQRSSQPSQYPRSPELKVLDRMAGLWRLEIVDARANEEATISTATGVGKWSLQGQYLEFRITGSDGNEAILHFFAYDSDARVYNMWSFSPDSPKPTLTTWRWDESEKSLTGQMDLGDGVAMQAVNHFITDDRFEYTATTKDAFGNVLREMEGAAFRRK